MKRIIILLLCLTMLLGGCGTKQPEPTQPPQTQPATELATEPTTEPTTVPTTEATTVPTTVETEPIYLYRHPLTGEALMDPMLTRPVAVIINNISAAQPLHGIGAADILCEITAEGGGTITRLLGIFTDLEAAGKIGSIRSARTYMIDLARAFDAPLVHCGYSEYARDEIRKTKYPSFNEFSYGKYFYRDEARRKAGYALEHTLFADGEDLLKGLLNNGFEMTIAEDREYGLQFMDEVILDGQSAKEITFRFYSEGGKRTVMTYDETDGVYYGTQKWKSKTKNFTDTNTGEDVPFKNVLLLYSKTTTDGYRMFADLTGEGTGYYACGGQIVPIKWYREKNTDPFSYTLEDGTLLTLAVGKTYMGIIPTRYPNIDIVG